MFLSSCKDFLKILFFSTATSIIVHNDFCKIFLSCASTCFQNKFLFNFDFEILNLANNFCAAEEVLWLLSLRKFFCLSVTFLWYRSYVSIRLLPKSDSHFFWQRIREEFRMSRNSSFQHFENSVKFSLWNGNSRKLLIRGAQLLGTILLWDLIVVLFKVPDAPPWLKWRIHVRFILKNGIKYNIDPWALKRSTREFVQGNIDRAEAWSHLPQPFLIAIVLMNKTIARLFHDPSDQMGFIALAPIWLGLHRDHASRFWLSCDSIVSQWAIIARARRLLVSWLHPNWILLGQYSKIRESDGTLPWNMWELVLLFESHIRPILEQKTDSTPAATSPKMTKMSWEQL